MPRTTRFVEFHPVLAESHQQRLQLELLSQRLGLVCKFFFGFPTPRDFAELCAVRCHECRADVLRVVVALGIDKHGLALSAGKLDHSRDVREPALTVVGQDDYVPIGDHPFVVRELVEQDFVTWRGLEIDAQHLLLPSDHAKLHRGCDVPVAV